MRTVHIFTIGLLLAALIVSIESVGSSSRSATDSKARAKGKTNEEKSSKAPKDSDSVKDSKHAQQGAQHPEGDSASNENSKLGSDGKPRPAWVNDFVRNMEAYHDEREAQKSGGSKSKKAGGSKSIVAGGSSSSSGARKKGSGLGCLLGAAACLDAINDC